MKNFRTMILLSLAFAAIPGALASQDSRILIQRFLEERIGSFVKSWDPAAHVFVTLEAREAKAVAVPGTPFTWKSLEIDGVQGLPPVSGMKITLLTSSAESLPESVKSVIQELASGFGVEPKVELRAIPQDASRALASIQEKSLPPASELPWLFMKMRHEWGTTAVVLFGALCLLFGGVGYAAWLRARLMDRVRASIEGGVGRLASALEETGVGGPGASRAQTANESTGATAAAAGARSGEKSSLPAASLASCLWDCYWAEADGYARFVWESVPSETRAQALASDPELREYVRYFSASCEPRDLGWFQESDYWSPLPLRHLSNASLADAVKQRPELYAWLPKIRKYSLPLAAAERLRFAELSKPVTDATWLSKIEASPRRALRVIEKIRFASVEEEEALFSEGSPETARHAEVPSLAWSRALSDEDARSVLEGFSAQELASAWVGPKSCLDRLEALLPEKKRKMLQGYVARGAASRDSGAFARLHHAFGEKLAPRKDQQDADTLAA